MLSVLDMDLSKEILAEQDSILQYISSKFVTINPCDKKCYNRHLEFVVDLLINLMKEEDKFFNLIYSKQCVAGSYWDKLKVGKPVEFDKNVILALPDCVVKHLQIKQASASFVCVDITKGIQELRKNPQQWELYKRMDGWIDGYGCITTNSIRSMMESIIDKVLNKLPKFDEKPNWNYKLSSCKAGPAITIKVEVMTDNIAFDVDIVPAFEFPDMMWPDYIRQCPDDCSARNWHIVPKPLLKDDCSEYSPNEQWRLSFHDQESQLIRNTYHLKPTLKLLKKLRDVKKLKLLSSYAIKTVFMWELDKQNQAFWNQRLSIVFLHMLEVLISYLQKERIPFYWDHKYNLLERLKSTQIQDLHRTFSSTHRKIIEGLTSKYNGLVVAKEILSSKEFEEIQKELLVNKIAGEV